MKAVICDKCGQALARQFAYILYVPTSTGNVMGHTEVDLCMPCYNQIFDFLDKKESEDE